MPRCPEDTFSSAADYLMIYQFVGKCNPGEGQAARNLPPPAPLSVPPGAPPCRHAQTCRTTSAPNATSPDKYRVSSADRESCPPSLVPFVVPLAKADVVLFITRQFLGT